MNETRGLAQMEEIIENASTRLDAIQCMLDSLILGMKTEKLEVQAILCLECVRYCISDLQSYINDPE